MTQETTSWIKWVALGCGGLLLLAASLGVGVYFMVKRATAEPEKVVDSFLAAAARGDYAAAHDHFAVPLKEVQPLDEFVARAESSPSLFRIVETSFSSRSVDSSGVKLVGTAMIEAGTKIPVSFQLVEENGTWKLIGYDLGS